MKAGEQSGAVTSREGRMPDSSGVRSALRLILSGQVQGLGVRPAIYRFATTLKLGGSVRNTLRGVEIEVEGSPESVVQFARNLVAELPPAARVRGLVHEELRPSGRCTFAIDRQSTAGPLAAPIPVDRAVCPECLKDICHQSDRRYRYAFTSCTQCGPRYSVIRVMPFEREYTTMTSFRLCPACEEEYHGTVDRRLHAQTIACPVCGPEVWATSPTGAERIIGERAIQQTATALLAGKIVAVRGLGGYQLLVDATNGPAVERLRTLKRRAAKPLAVMVESLHAAERIAYFGEVERAVFTSPAAPIVLVRAQKSNGLADAIAPNLDEIGLMRPTTPLHAILATEVRRALVCTSANREGEPLEYEVESATYRLAGICDLWLHHNRPIERPIDDSVVRVITGRSVSLRLARGLAPLTLELPNMPPTLAVGGYLKAAVAWSNGVQATLGPHIGDQEGLAARERWVTQLGDWQRLYGFTPRHIVHDLHPDYFSTRWAQSQGLHTFAVQHHHAHMVAAMLEHGLLSRRVLGVTWDGTGYGIDGTIWGGEFLIGDDAEFIRYAHFRPFRLPGGEAAIHEPWRIAAALCHEAECDIYSLSAQVAVDPQRLAAVIKIAGRPDLSPITTSAGRLIDAAAAVILGITSVRFEGEAAMRLEAAADRSAIGEYTFSLKFNKDPELDWRPLVSELLADCRRGTEPSVMAMRFHRSLARGLVSVCQAAPRLPIVLCGGVFQNRLLTELVIELADEHCRIYLPGVIPPNDGGLAAGQLAVAAARLGRSPCA